MSVFGCPADAQTTSPQRILAGFGPQAALTSYLGVQGTNRFRLDGVLFAQSRIRLADIADGASNTLAVGERPPCPDASWGFWYLSLFGIGPTYTGASVLGVREPSHGAKPVPLLCERRVYEFGPGSVSNPCDAMHFWSTHSFGGHFLLADGAVRFLSYSANDLLPALATRARGDVAVIPD